MKTIAKILLTTIAIYIVAYLTCLLMAASSRLILVEPHVRNYLFGISFSFWVIFMIGYIFELFNIKLRK